MRYPLTKLLSLAAILILLPNCKKVESVTKQQQAEKELRESVKQLKRDANEQLDKNGHISGSGKSSDKTIRALEKLGKNSSGLIAAEAKITTIWLTQMKNLSSELQEGAKLLNQAADYSQIKTIQDISSLSDKVKKYKKLNNKIIQYINEDFMNEVKEKASKQGISEQSIKEIFPVIKKGFEKQKPYLLEIRHIDNDTCNAILEQHGILKSSFGKWKWDSKSELPNFSENKTLQKYNKASLEIQQALQKQVTLQRKLLQAHRK